ncbi:AbrB/MazE/SpoVT family DNA-binding domain-containing protein [Microvirga arsenatis]|uniref:AbrB/MazE/SpoVT family DNA-binding domain-containing protein n=1 Tax=Microvirga arsenatis TaxID=2692265 RepID=A0ABW9Z6D9_9HYPH|nr:AbrB/MazE/SpoVT family DNA-binding domain-containing protein [Microvirga arsenatis]NBJ13811.1 AbrB/MazE/SpoVT family DNA-binding domain-containing protein [Microvirga arsenatis]NBJ27265.1 AbrB/MazE/SpoVT family DNA-binding domain-containing protein [Microvirga arsenatis]
MRVHFAQWGNSLALRIPHAFAQELDAAPGRPAEVTILDGRLIVAPVQDVPVYSLDELLAGMTEDNLHGEVSMGAAVGNEFA